MKKQVQSKTKLKGVVTKQLFKTKELNKLKLMIERNDNPVSITRQLKKARKPLFKHNRLWKAIKHLTGRDLKIPFLTGLWTYDPLTQNTVTTRGKQIVAEQTGGTTTAPVTAIALGTGTPTTTALGTEITTGGGGRGAATITNETTTTTGDTEQWIKTFNFTSAFAITEEGLFDNNTTGGNMLASQSFSAINVTNGDSLQITHSLVVS